MTKLKTLILICPSIFFTDPRCNREFLKKLNVFKERQRKFGIFYEDGEKEVDKYSKHREIIRAEILMVIKRTPK